MTDYKCNTEGCSVGDCDNCRVVAELRRERDDAYWVIARDHAKRAKDGAVCDCVICQHVRAACKTDELVQACRTLVAAEDAVPGEYITPEAIRAICAAQDTFRALATPAAILALAQRSA